MWLRTDDDAPMLHLALLHRRFQIEALIEGRQPLWHLWQPSWKPCLMRCHWLHHKTRRSDADHRVHLRTVLIIIPSVPIHFLTSLSRAQPPWKRWQTFMTTLPQRFTVNAYIERGAGSCSARRPIPSHRFAISSKRTKEQGVLHMNNLKSII